MIRKLLVVAAMLCVTAPALAQSGRDAPCLRTQ